MKIGLYGGSFDPVHRGHVAVARAVRKAHALDRVLFVPAASPPHKAANVAPAADRLRMVEIAVSGEPGLEACDLELARGGVSYTVDTLEELREREPESELFLVLGADSLGDLPEWKDLPRIAALARIVVVDRPGFDVGLDPAGFPGVPRETVERWRSDRVEMEPVAVASRDLRRELAREGRARCPEGLPEPVWRHIVGRGLYGTDRASDAPRREAPDDAGARRPRR